VNVLHMFPEIPTPVLGNTTEDTSVQTAPVIQLLNVGIQTVHTFKTNKNIEFILDDKIKLNPKLFGIFLKIFKYHACLLIF
jgi:hypothetical protein